MVLNCTPKECCTAPSKDVQSNVTEQSQSCWEISAWHNTFKQCQSFEMLNAVLQ